MFNLAKFHRDSGLSERRCERDGCEEWEARCDVTRSLVSWRHRHSLSNACTSRVMCIFEVIVELPLGEVKRKLLYQVDPS